MFRICTKCNEEKELEKFVRQGKAYRYKCKDCWNKERRTGMPNTGRFKKGISSSPLTQFKKGQVSTFKGKNHSEESINKMKDSLKGRIAWNKGILRPEKRKPSRDGFLAREWKKKILERDGYKCTKCSSKKRLHCHHIKPWKEFLDLRFDIDNGITLCQSCHMKIEKIGKKFSDEHRRKLSEARKGKCSKRKGTKLVDGKYVKLEGN